QGLACSGYDEASLTSLSTTDHSQIEDILHRLNRRLESTGISISIPSQRVDAFGVDIAQLVAGEKKGGLTFAPEAGTQRLRDIINKNITEEDLLTAISSAFSAGWRRLKLYFMCGLPGETDEDLIGMGKLVRRAYETAKDSVPNQERGNVRMSVSCALFVPKPHTPFQWCGQIPSDEIERRIALIRSAMPGKGVDFHWHDSSTSFVESTIARGGREMGAVILHAWENGARFDAWREHFSLAFWTDAATKAGVSLDEISARSFDLADHLPWEHISTGVSIEFMKDEYRKAFEAQTTPDCTFSSCTDCGVCPTLDCGIVLGGGTRG
ncbi:MAG: radical SAM protein, partial [Actinobacteria bacterium]|nr:radical SAM protein [Actinomycetota bacterium]